MSKELRITKAKIKNRTEEEYKNNPTLFNYDIILILRNIDVELSAIRQILFNDNRSRE